jgi:hypothetical protein
LFCGLISIVETFLASYSQSVIDVVYCQHLIVTSPGWEHSGLPISLCIMYPLLSKWSSLLVNHLKFIHKVNDHKMHTKCNFTLSLFWNRVQCWNEVPLMQSYWSIDQNNSTLEVPYDEQSNQNRFQLCCS